MRFKTHERVKENTVKQNQTKRVINYILIGLITVITIVASLKSLIIGLDVDEQYAVTLIYRLAKGDRILKECFEPHCTSAILPTIFAKAYLFIKGDSEYLLLFLRALGMIGSFGVSVYWYLTFKKKFSKEMSFLTAVFLFIISPKWIVLPEFAGMELFALVGMFCGISAYMFSGKKYHLVVAGLFATIMIFSYPSTVIVGIVTFVLLCVIIDGGHKKDVILFVIPIALSGIIFAMYLLTYLSPGEIINNVQILLSDGEHQETIIQKAFEYAKELGVGLIYCVIYGVIASALTAIVCIGKKNRTENKPIFWGCTFVIVTACIHQIYLWVFKGAPTVHPQYRYLIAEVLSIIVSMALIKGKKKIDTKQKLLLLSLAIGFTSLVSVLLLTNLTLKASLVHGLISVVFACLIAGEAFSTKKMCVYVSLTMLIVTGLFGRVYLVRASEGYHRTVFMVRQKTLYGAEKYNYPPYMEGYQYNEDYVWLRELIPDGSKVLYIGNNMMTYLIGDYDICTDSTISTPTFGLNLLLYYEMNPNKRPVYVITDNAFMDSHTVGDEVYGYVMDNYHAIGEGEFCMCYECNE